MVLHKAQLGQESVDQRGGLSQFRVIPYMEFTSSHTTATNNGATVPNFDGLIDSVFAEIVVDDTLSTGAGTSSVSMKLEGSQDGTNFYPMVDSAGASISVIGIDIASAPTTTVSRAIDTLQEGRKRFPPYFRVSVVVDDGGVVGKVFLAYSHNSTARISV